MNTLFLLPVFIGSLLSLWGFGRLTLHEYVGGQTRSLSELAAARPELLSSFRTTLYGCDVLFAVTMYGYVIPHLAFRDLEAIVWTMTAVCVALVGALPARDETAHAHRQAARYMALGLIFTSFISWYNLSGVYGVLELIDLFALLVLGTFSLFDEKHFLFYELPFIYLSHLGIMIAAIGLA